jgi:hypothetical protein
MGEMYRIKSYSLEIMKQNSSLFLPDGSKIASVGVIRGEPYIFTLEPLGVDNKSLYELYVTYGDVDVVDEEFNYVGVFFIKDMTYHLLWRIA